MIPVGSVTKVCSGRIFLCSVWRGPVGNNRHQRAPTTPPPPRPWWRGFDQVLCVGSHDR